MRQSIQEWTKWNLWKTAFKTFKVIWSAQADHVTSNFLKAVFHKIYLVHSWILCPMYVWPFSRHQELKGYTEGTMHKILAISIFSGPHIIGLLLFVHLIEMTIKSKYFAQSTCNLVRVSCLRSLSYWSHYHVMWLSWCHYQK